MGIAHPLMVKTMMDLMRDEIAEERAAMSPEEIYEEQTRKLADLA